MWTFLSVTGWTAVALVLLGIAGGFVLSGIHQNRPFALLMAPMCGMLVLPPIITLCFSTGQLSLKGAAIAGMTLATAATIVTSVWVRWRPQHMVASALLLALVGTLFAVLANAASIHNGTPTFLFMDGTDHAGYAHLADWLLLTPPGHMPIADPADIYQSWPDHMYRTDPRLSAFVLLALITLPRGISAIFTYDLACGIILTAAIVGVAAMFSRSRWTLAIMIFALTLSVWFEYSRAGYLGKIIAYPGILLIIGLLLTTRDWSPKTVGALTLLVIGVSTMQSSMSVVLFLIAVGSPLVIAQAIQGERAIAERYLYMFTVAALVAFASSGMFARFSLLPPTFGFSEAQTWGWLIPHLMETQHPTRDYIPISTDWLHAATATAILLQVMLIAACVYRRDARAIALTLGPTLVAAILFVLDQKWAAYQMSGFVVTFSAAALVLMVDDEPNPSRALSTIVAVFAVVFIGIRLPRVAVALQNYALRPPATEQYRLSDMIALASKIGRDRVVLVDIANPQPALTILLYFKERVPHVQWTTQTWNAVVGYRGWPAPKYDATPDFWLGDASVKGAPSGDILMQTERLRLVKLK